MRQHRHLVTIPTTVALVTGVALMALTAAAGAAAPAARASAPNPGVWSRAVEPAGFTSLNVGGYSELLSVSCGGAGSCAAVGDFRDVAHSERTQALIVEKVRGRWSAGFKAPGSAALNGGGFAQLYSVSCSSPGNCAAGGGYRDAHGGFQAFLIDEVHGTWQAAFEVKGSGSLNAGGTASVKAVSCPVAGRCTAGGFYTDASGHVQAFVVDQAAGTWRSAAEVPGSAALNIDGNASVNTISCPAAGQCMAGGGYKDGALGFQAFLASEVDGTWSAAVEVPGSSALNKGALASVTQVWCASVGSCTAGGTYRDASFKHEQAFVIDESNGTWGTALEVPGSATLNAGGIAHLSALSCARAGECAAGGSYLDATGKIQSFVVDEVHGHWTKAHEVPGTGPLNVTSGGEGVASISCSAPGACAAAGDYGDAAGGAPVYVVNEVAGRWGRAVPAPGTAALNRGDSATIYQVTCTAVGTCAAVGNYRSGGGPYEVFATDFHPAPVVLAVTPHAGPQGGGYGLIIHGLHLDGATVVLFGGRRASHLRLVNPGALRVVIPAGAGTVVVRVRSAGGYSDPSGRARFTYAATPVVRSVSPASGRATGGTRVEIRGANLTGVLAVLFGRHRATDVVVVNADVLRVSAPPGGGRVVVRVVTYGGASAPVAADWFRYHP